MMGMMMFEILLQTCKEESAGTVAEILAFFLDECEIEQAPNPITVTECRDILKKRGGKFERLANLCQQWLDDEASL